MTQNQLKTREQVLEELAYKGLSVRAWAVSNQLCPSTVRAVMNGKLKGRIGEGHKIAVLLGLKRGEIV